MSIKILVVNPNSSISMTNALKPRLETLSSPDTTYTYFTAPPPSPPSINNASETLLSAQVSFPHVHPLAATHDAILLACYSVHPLIAMLREAGVEIPILGIFEASVSTALLLGVEMFGIVTTGKQWEGILTDGVKAYIGGESGRFSGVESTGLSAGELEEAPKEMVEERMKAATKRLLVKGEGVEVVCLGCSAMAGMGRVIEEAAKEVGRTVIVVDGVVAGAGLLGALVRVKRFGSEEK